MLMSTAIGVGVFSKSKSISVSAYDAEEFPDAIKIGDSYTANSFFNVTDSYVEFAYFDLLVPDTGYRQTLFLNGGGILGHWSNNFSGLVLFDFDIDETSNNISYSYYLSLPISYKLSKYVFVLPINDFVFISHIKVRFYLTMPFSELDKTDLQENIHENYLNLYSGLPNIEPLGFGYQDGYDFGYKDGYDEGLYDGRNEDFNAYSWLTGLFYAMGGLLSIQLLPNVSIGGILILILVLTLLPFLIGLIKGGKS